MSRCAMYLLTQIEKLILVYVNMYRLHNFSLYCSINWLVTLFIYVLTIYHMSKILGPDNINASQRHQLSTRNCMGCQTNCTNIFIWKWKQLTVYIINTGNSAKMALTTVRLYECISIVNGVRLRGFLKLRFGICIGIGLLSTQ